ncbi:hypothetical protein DEO72_LG3g1268 [Vigna unguiculata]|uniref:Uncharacterized protein n=1 Tax=Vigna unguiculata TaxID=3917 RepID=A0A4D6LDQ9_VIGUN|nr:hypothetical protein DEO72_LG3g1268 [Vigna unguiculata]
MSSSDSSSLSTSSSSQSTESDRSRDDRLHGEGVSAGVGTSGVPREVVREIREDPPKELEESNWPAKGGYAWVASDVRDQSSLFRWSRLLNSWLNCTPVISRGAVSYTHLDVYKRQAGVGTSGVPREVVREIREEPPKQLEASNWPAKGGYAGVASDVRDQSSLFRWSRLLNSSLNCTPVISRGVSGDIVSLERVSAIDRVCHGQEGAAKKFCYMYMCHFSQLHIRLPFDDFTMGRIGVEMTGFMERV